MVRRDLFSNSTKLTPGNISHETAACPPQPADEATVVGIVFAYSVLLLASVTGNSLIIHIIRTKNSLMHISFNHIILNLAVADLIYALFVVPLSLTFLFIHSRWFPGIFGVLSCKLLQFCAVAALESTILTLCTIAGERYWGILHAMRSPLSLKAVRRLIGVIWLAAALLASPQLYSFTTIRVQDGNYYCVPEWSKNIEKNITISKAFHVLTFFISYAVPLSIIIVLYGRMIFYMWTRTPPGEDNATNNKKAKTQGYQVVTMLVAVVTAFALCWLPAHVCHYLISFQYDVYSCLPLAVPLVLFWFAHANSAINPWLCIMFNNKFRTVCFRMVRFFPRRHKKCGSSSAIEMRNMFTMNTLLSQRRGLAESLSTPKFLQSSFSLSHASTPQSLRRSCFKQDSPNATPLTLRRGIYNAAVTKQQKSPDSPLTLNFNYYSDERQTVEVSPPASPPL